MTFEERIDRLTERHEALAQSLELLALEVRENSQAAKALLEASARQAETSARHEDRLGKQEALIAQILEATARNNETVANLALIARVHSERLARLEEGKR